MSVDVSKQSLAEREGFEPASCGIGNTHFFTHIGWHMQFYDEDSRAAAALDFECAPCRFRLKAPPGHLVYFVGGEGGPIKIGFTQQPIKARLKCIQNGSPIKLRVLALQPAPRARESFYHRQFAAHRLHGEWFERHPDILAEIERLNAHPRAPETWRMM